MDQSRPAPAPGPHRLALEGIVKRFAGAVLANDHIDLALRPGEIHALLGENGAGKSTLVKIIYGVLHADEGRVLWEGQPVTISSPARARALGIGMVFQHFSLFESLTVTENVQLALDGRQGENLAQAIDEVAGRYGLALDPKQRICDLSVGERQRVEIVRCLLQNPRLLIMDEPTSVLTPSEVESLFVTLRRLAGEGVSILYISHKLDEIRALCHRATILRAGRVVGACDPATTSTRDLARLMIGEDPGALERRDPPVWPHAAGDEAPRLELERLSMDAESPFAPPLTDVSLKVRSGEIVGIAGVAGNGQGTLLAALSGEHRAPRPEAVRVDGVAVGHLGPAARRDLGLAVVPEERLGRGAVPELSLAENALLSSYRSGALVRRGLIDRTRAHGLARTIIERFGVRAGGSRAAAGSLSGGNLQKFIIGRELLQKPRLLIASQPTWGVDAGAAAAIHRALLELRNQGGALLIISQDLDELFAIADRIAVLCAGRLSATRPVHEVSLEQVGLMMGGLFDDVPTPAPEARS
ncbi:ABC transporter ATP-binding protein [Pararhodospirillum oryzae]|nr:ABC transporter ATP-binding protein [Pararhodospirillum oryzae]